MTRDLHLCARVRIGSINANNDRNPTNIISPDGSPIQCQMEQRFCHRVRAREWLKRIVSDFIQSSASAIASTAVTSSALETAYSSTPSLSVYPTAGDEERDCVNN